MVLAIEGIDRIKKDPFIYKYIDEAFGGIDILKKSTDLSYQCTNSSNSG